MTQKTLTYRFVLSDREIASAWLREYFRRPGWRAWRVIGGPCFIGIGIVLTQSAELFMRGIGLATIGLGLWYAAKPFIGARLISQDRRRRGLSDLEIEVRLGRDGLRIDDGRVRKEIPWSDVVRAGASSEYIWYELRGGSRATIPLRVVEDREALRTKLAAHCRWE